MDGHTAYPLKLHRKIQSIRYALKKRREGKFMEDSCGGAIILGQSDASGTVLDMFEMNGGRIDNHHA